jgi:intracellular multiplication protein IcmL
MGPGGKGGKKLPQPLLPPVEQVKAPPPVLTRQQKVKKALKEKTAKIPVKSPFATPAISADIVNEQIEVARANRAFKRVTRMSVLLGIFCCILSFGAPFFAPLYVFHSITPEGKTAILVPLEIPNLTNPAIVNWAATSVTEILSFGFGDVEAKTVQQKLRFTPAGWKAFVKAFLSTKVSETFKRNQMVMTTVPVDTPIILSQGVNSEDTYEWKVEVPIITTYAANNNVIKPERGLIQMTIIRVPHDQSAAGIAIDIWKQIKH